MTLTSEDCYAITNLEKLPRRGVSAVDFPLGMVVSYQGRQNGVIIETQEGTLDLSGPYPKSDCSSGEHKESDAKNNVLDRSRADLAHIFHKRGTFHAKQTTV